MLYKVRNTSLAKKTLVNNIDYLLKEFGEKQVDVFLNKVDDVTKLLETDPYVFQKYNTDTYKILIVKQITMYYSVNLKNVHILLFWNNYKNPKTLIELISLDG